MNMARHGKKWSFRDLQKLIELYEQGVRWGAISNALGRSVPTCVARLRTVRFYFRMPAELWAIENETTTGKANLQIKGRDGY